jgi:hypothetical protein
VRERLREDGVNLLAKEELAVVSGEENLDLSGRQRSPRGEAATVLL